MPFTEFDAFRHSLCEALGLSPPVTAPTGDAPDAFSIDFQGVDMVLAPTGPACTPQALLWVDFGDVPEHERAQVYPALLQANFLMLDGGAPAFSLHPESARVTYQIRFRLDQAEPHALAGALGGIASAVMQWRENRLLQPVHGTGPWA